jgi:hypothetical protein
MMGAGHTPLSCLSGVIGAAPSSASAARLRCLLRAVEKTFLPQPNLELKKNFKLHKPRANGTKGSGAEGSKCAIEARAPVV